MSSDTAYASQEHAEAMRFSTGALDNKTHDIQMIEHADMQDYNMENDDTAADFYEEREANSSSLDLAYHASTLSTDAESLSRAIEAARDQLDIPGLVNSEPTKHDALTVLYLSEASKKLGKTNSAYFYQQQAMTIAEIIELKAKKLQRSRYGSTTPTGTLIPDTELRNTLDRWKKEAEMERQQQQKQLN
ncbi:hypothetical protein BCR37DRAFT_391275 [Protomyces lactucae-debilis]|uniref:Uncharacterized protein n=1 Tax=Protomyces lactucae-debilis TaxID=2754530 RepID=A0A1Y2FPH0_PROLT|nr:uncharacterized protein BCR37DRAFT_391275 [Protomyces lactucae-debilis]ORY85497.1 hypothetical protein BCR37DRAFT_391275 [Protomyces lactucae-debilis]